MIRRRRLADMRRDELLALLLPGVRTIYTTHSSVDTSAGGEFGDEKIQMGKGVIGWIDCGDFGRCRLRLQR
jgi:hypothetical protein